MKRFVVLLVAFLLVCGYLFAQNSGSDTSEVNIRIGYVDRTCLIDSFPALLQAEAELSRMLGEYETEFLFLTQEYNGKVKAYMEGKNSMSEAMKLARRTEITEMESMLNLYKKRYLAELDGKRDELVAPQIRKIDDAIRNVAERYRITILFDKEQPLYMSADCVDITADVKSELGIKTGQTEK